MHGLAAAHAPSVHVPLLQSPPAAQGAPVRPRVAHVPFSHALSTHAEFGSVQSSPGHRASRHFSAAHVSPARQ